MRIREAIATFRGHHTPNFNFVGRKHIWFAFSGALIALSLVGLFVRGLNFSIAFTGGSLLEFENRSEASVADYQAVMARFGLEEATVEILGGGTVAIRTESLTELGAPATPSPATPSPTTTATPSPTATPTPTASPTQDSSPTPAPSPTATASPTPTTATSIRADRLRQALADLAGIGLEEINEQDVGPTWGSTISRKAITSLIVFLVLVTLYITIRFELKMAAGALIALGHDIIITAGIFALVGREVSPETVIAILTILGFSLYDTVVIYDKVKENTELAAVVARDTYSGVVNASLNQVFMRSVNTSLVVLLPIGALLLFGGQTLKDFAFALFVGVAIGVYSSIFVAAPVLAVVKEREPRYQQIRTRAQARAARPGLRAVPSARAARGQGAERELEPAASVAAVPGPSGPSTTARTRGAGSARKKKGRPQGKPKRRRR
ncbi:MAG: protein translocase subunit SecF [Actinomycetota bacterium]